MLSRIRKSRREGAVTPAGRGSHGQEGGLTDAVEAIVRRLDAALPFTQVTTQPPPGTSSVQAIVQASRSDPLAAWREEFRGVLEARHRVPVRAHVPAAFVLQWWCEVAAIPIAYAAELGPWLLAGPSGLGFTLAPGLYPDHLVLGPDLSLEVVAAHDERIERARAAYRRVVDDVVGHFAPDVKMSSRQRWGVVEDTWRTAHRRAGHAAGRQTGPELWRTSCCFIYALPEMRACASCPRRRRP